MKNKLILSAVAAVALAGMLGSAVAFAAAAPNGSNTKPAAKPAIVKPVPPKGKKVGNPHPLGTSVQKPVTKGQKPKKPLPPTAGKKVGTPRPTTVPAGTPAPAAH